MKVISRNQACMHAAGVPGLKKQGEKSGIDQGDCAVLNSWLDKFAKSKDKLLNSS